MFAHHFFTHNCCKVAVFNGPWWPRATGAGTGQVTARAKRGTIVMSINKYEMNIWIYIFVPGDII